MKKDRFIADFWQWTDYADYLQFVALFTVVFGALTLIFINVPIYVETLGFLAVFIEAMQGVPQFYRNFRNKSTEGMSVIMVCMWLSGDTFKTSYVVLLCFALPLTFEQNSVLLEVRLARLGRLWGSNCQQASSPHAPCVHRLSKSLHATTPLCTERWRRYFIMRDAPFQFGMCGVLQMCVDLSLITQVFLFRGNREPQRELKAEA
jgi:hypothetical protein